MKPQVAWSCRAAAPWARTIIRASNDADVANEFEIQLTGIKALTAVDFYL